MTEPNVVTIARCPVHGFNVRVEMGFDSERDDYQSYCVRCKAHGHSTVVEQVEMVPKEDYDALEKVKVRAALGLLRLQIIVCQAADFLEARRAEEFDFPFDSRPLRKLLAAALDPLAPPEQEPQP